jgi:lipid II:glycine glycyltransferase (peptidoglycan interpeptide bridge formation enzyme)
MNLRKINSVELSELPNGNDILQSSFWGRHKSCFGWSPYSFIYQGEALLVLTRKVLGRYLIAYIPHGPNVTLNNKISSELRDIGLLLKNELPGGCFVLRFDISAGVFQTELFEFNLGPELKKASSDIQVPDTVIISLRESEEDILARMKTKTRYNIRLSFRKGVKVVRAGEESLDEWYRIYEETAVRDKITIHSRDYYKKLFELSAGEKAVKENPRIILFKAVFDGQMLAGTIVSLFGSKATYLYGASSDEYRNLMPAYALQWEGIKYAKEQGCSLYDLFGIPPENNPEHPMSGLYRFKTGFGGQILHRPGCWDLPLKPVIYTVYRLAESIRLFYYKKIRKR